MRAHGRSAGTLLVLITLVLSAGGSAPEPASSSGPVSFEPSAEARPDYGAPGARQIQAAMERLPLDRTVDTRALYRDAERRLATMPRYSAALGSRVADPQRQFRELEGAWESLGPGNIGGRTRAMAIDPGNPRTLYVGGVSGGVWKSRDGGRRWSAVGDALQNVAVNSMAMHPHDGDTLVVGTGEGYFREDVRYTGLPLRGGGVFRTEDGARSWTRLEATSGEDFWFVNDLVYSADGERLYAATRTGVHRTVDGGASWERILNPKVQGGCLDLAIRPGSATDVLFAACGTFEQASVWRTRDAGAARTATQDRAPDWEKVLSDPGMGRTTIAIAPSDPQVIYALSASIQKGRFEGALHGVFRSTDGGDRWTARVRNSDAGLINRSLLENPLVVVGETCGFGSYGDPVPMGWYVNSLGVDPVDADILWAGGVDWFRSDDGGATWGPASFWWGGSNPAGVHADQHAIRFDPGYDGEGNQTAYVLTDGGIFVTDNARGPVSTLDNALCSPASSGVAFRDLNRGFGITQYYHGSVSPGGDVILAGAQDNGTNLWRRGDRENDWGSVFGGDGGYSAIDPLDPDTWYVQSQFSNVRVSTNGGQSTVGGRGNLPEPVVNLLGPGKNFLFITPLTVFPATAGRLPGTVLLGGNQLWLSENRGVSWRAVSRTLPRRGQASAIATSPHDGETVLVGTDKGHLLRTDRLDSLGSGSRWPSKRPRRAWVTSVAFDPGDADTYYATYGGFGGQHVYRSSGNRGRRWQSIDGNLPDIPVHSIVVDPDDGDRIFIGTDLGVFVTTDGGQTWAQEIAGFGNIVTEWLVLQREGAKLMLYAFTHGRGAWRVEVAH